MTGIGQIVVTEEKIRSRFAMPTESRSFCRRAFCCLGIFGLIPIAIGTIAFLGGFGGILPAHNTCLVFAAGVGLTIFFEVYLIMTILQELKMAKIKKSKENSPIDL